MAKSIIIVGAGISGLSAGYYAQKNGYETSIYEMHSLPGGLCTAWKRKGYIFDISMHMLTGSVSGPFHQMWKELGVIDKFRFHFHEQITRIEGMGKQLTYTTHQAEVEEEMLKISPEDEILIKDFMRLIYGPDMMGAASLTPKKLQHLGDSIRTMLALFPLFRTFGKYNQQTVQEFADKFTDPFLQQAVRFFIDSPGWPMKRFPMVALAGFVRSAVSEAGAPIGGSQQVIYHMEDRYKKAGGEIHYKSKVVQLIMDQDKVIGIELKDGSRHLADEVIWAGDGYHLIYQMLEGKYVDEKIEKMYTEWIPVKPILHVMMGVNMDLSKEPHQIVFETDDPIVVAGKEHRWLTFLHHGFDPTMAPEGKSAVEVWYDTEYDYWEQLSGDREAYKKEKKRIADYTIEQLDKRWPGFASSVEVVDVPTPSTYYRYTGNWKGSPDGWYITPENMRQNEPIRSLPGLEGIHMIGQWTAPFTGTVLAALTGRQVIQLMCKKEKRRFVT
jgi:phytoene dehydrogenase-like protein